MRQGSFFLLALVFPVKYQLSMPRPKEILKKLDRVVDDVFQDTEEAKAQKDFDTFQDLTELLFLIRKAKEKAQTMVKE
jgi:hypothetical protein